MKDADGIAFEEFLVIPFKDQYEFLRRVSQLPRVAYEFRIRAAQKRKALLEAKRKLDVKSQRAKDALAGQKNPVTGKLYSLEWVKEAAKEKTSEQQKEVDRLTYQLECIEAMVSCLNDMSGLLRGEQGRWNRETDSNRVANS